MAGSYLLEEIKYSSPHDQELCRPINKTGEQISYYSSTSCGLMNRRICQKGET